MFRLVGFKDENALEDELYMYLSSAISKTIIDCLDRFTSAQLYNMFFLRTFWDHFFDGLSKYIKPTGQNSLATDEDTQAGYEFTLSKMNRMKEKMQDTQKVYTFDIFEERILYYMCDFMDTYGKGILPKEEKEALKEKRKTAKKILKEKFELPSDTAKDYSKKMYFASSMLLKDEEEENLIFWDDDFEFFWRDGFLQGIEYTKDFSGEMMGYGYQYACNIFSDVGIKPPLMLLGTQEANKVATEVQKDLYSKFMNDFANNIKSMSLKELESHYSFSYDKDDEDDDDGDYHNADYDDEDLPMN